MSLTSELSSATSWVNNYFKSKFGGVVGFTRVEGPNINTLETKIPTTLKGRSLSRVGTAIDYNIRLEWGLKPLDSSVISAGIKRMELLGPQNTPEERVEWAETVRSYLTTVDDRSDEGLAKTAILLAHLDAGFRSGGIWGEDMAEIARGVAAEGLTPSRLLEVTRQEETSEVAKLAGLARESLKFEERESIMMGPSFDGSPYVGGADADFIIGGCLYEIKTTVNPRRRLSTTIRQLIGYTLLDWNDEFEIREVGVYFSRQGAKVTWDLEDLIARTAMNSQTGLSEFRKEFEQLAMVECNKGGVEEKPI